MKIPPLPFTVTDWSAVAPTVHPGETGEAVWRTFTIGDLRVRQVEYTPGYLADGTSSTYSKANSIPNFATGEHSSCCRG